MAQKVRKMAEGGKKIWYFPDGFLPAKNPESAMIAHEALMIFNTLEEDVQVVIDIYYSDREPVKGIPVTVPAERVISLRMDLKEDLNGVEIPLLTQYALRVTASAPVVVQFGRLDTTQNNMSYYLGVGFCE